jgi:GT2 family glycosyltransferase
MAGHSNKLCVLVVNYNTMEFTINCMADLLMQQIDDKFDIVLVDQGSSELITETALYYFERLNVKVIRNRENVALSKVWNDFYRDNKYEYLCFLNNDTRLTSNFIKDTLDVLDNHKSAGCVVHATNHPSYQKQKSSLEFYYDQNCMQGWDFTIRRRLFVEIPESLLLYYGDQWLFTQMYSRGYKTAIVVSSPIIHFCRQSTTEDILEHNHDPKIYSLICPDEKMLYPNFDYSKYKPTFDFK